MQAQVRPAPATLARLTERMHEHAFERVVGLPPHQLATQVSDAVAAMCAPYGRLLDATRLRGGPEVAAARLQVAVTRIRPGMEKKSTRSRLAQRGPAPAPAESSGRRLASG